MIEWMWGFLTGIALWVMADLAFIGFLWYMGFDFRQLRLNRLILRRKAKEAINRAKVKRGWPREP